MRAPPYAPRPGWGDIRGGSWSSTSRRVPEICCSAGEKFFGPSCRIGSSRSRRTTARRRQVRMKIRSINPLLNFLLFLVIGFLFLLPASWCAVAQTTKAPLEVVVLGSGGPRPFGRGGSSYIVEVEGTPRILVDAGPGAFIRIGELGLDLSAVDTVLLTHLHIDHAGDLPAFFNARALTADGPITYRIFGPDGAGLFPKTSRFVDLLVGDGGAFAYQKTFGADEKFVVKDLAINLDPTETRIVDEKGLTIDEIATHHGDCPSVAYRISYKGVTVVFSGDMDASAIPNLEKLAKDANLLIFNCAVLDPPGSPEQLYELHTPPKKIGEAAKAAGVKSLLLSHTAPDVESREAAVRASIRANFSMPVACTTDRLDVPVRSQSGFCEVWISEPVETVLFFMDRINQHDADKLVELVTDDHEFVDSLGKAMHGKENALKGWR